MTSAEFTEWIAYSTLEPFGPLADDNRAGGIAAATTGTVPREPTQTKPLLPEDYFPTLKPEGPRPKKQTAEDMMAVLRGMAARGFGTYTEGK